jgi:hypothetical protein
LQEIILDNVLTPVQVVVQSAVIIKLGHTTLQYMENFVLVGLEDPAI